MQIDILRDNPTKAPIQKNSNENADANETNTLVSLPELYYKAYTCTIQMCFHEMCTLSVADLHW